jgi:hypothetical protein
VLRNPLDTKVADTKGTAVSELFGGMQRAPVAQRAYAAPRPVVVPPPAPAVVEIINGTKRVQSTFAGEQK